MGQEISRRTVWVIEDDEGVREVVADSLRSARFDVTALARAEGVLERLTSSVPDVIVLDLGMPRGAMQGMELLARLREIDAARQLPVVVLSGYGDIVNRDVMGRLGVAAIFTKPLAGFEGLVRRLTEITGT
jgi:two-component system, NtrC family, nitrogen regulation response regulator GlnG